MTNNRAIYKQQAAEYAVQFVESGMAVGLGTGSTALFATRCLARMLREANLREIVAVATSDSVRIEAEQLGIPMLDSAIDRTLNITIDGADEVDSALNLIKGAGGALLREKIVAQASERVVIVIDDGKLSESIGTRSKLPVEVLEFGWESQYRFLSELMLHPELRKTTSGDVFYTDSGNLILDCITGVIPDVSSLMAILGARAGIIEHGIFHGLATDVVVAGEDGIRHITRPL
jgi:ribose 5-phosphate isomerase A